VPRVLAEAETIAEAQAKATTVQRAVQRVALGACYPVAPTYLEISVSVAAGGVGVAYTDARPDLGEGPEKAFDGDLTTFWNAAGTNSPPNQLDFIIFQTSSPVVSTQLGLVTYGDTTHDVKAFTFSYGSSVSGPWTVAFTGTAQAGVKTWQAFPLTTDSKPHAFWKFASASRYSQYQAYITELLLMTCDNE